MRDFDAKDLSALDAGAVSDMIDIFCKLFFFDSIHRIDFDWSTDPSTDGVGYSIMQPEDDRWYREVRMHPTETKMETELLQHLGTALYEQRIGTLLYELIHCFLTQHACRGCKVFQLYRGEGHGRDFQLIAKAIEDNALVLLGTSIEFGRLDGIKIDKYMDPPDPLRGLSVHDTEIYGFLPPPSKDVASSEMFSTPPASEQLSSPIKPLDEARKRKLSDSPKLMDVESLESGELVETRAGNKDVEFFRLSRTDPYLARTPFYAAPVTSLSDPRSNHCRAKAGHFSKSEDEDGGPEGESTEGVQGHSNGQNAIGSVSGHAERGRESERLRLDGENGDRGEKMALDGASVQQP